MRRTATASFAALIGLAGITGLVAASPAAGATSDTGPALETDPAQLDGALSCPDSFAAAGQPVLLVHGTFVTPDENYGWAYVPALGARGLDVCTVTLPERSLGDMQVQAEYVVHAVRRIHAQSGEPVDLVGHSQGGVHPRWAVKWWPDVGAAVDDIVMLAAPSHGTGWSFTEPRGCFASCWQMAPGSAYLTALNRGSETPGEADYTSIYSLFDELVQPQYPESTSAVAGPPERTANVLVQDVCPARPVDHASFAWDGAVFGLVLDALTHDGPTSVDRTLAGDPGLCTRRAIEEAEWEQGPDILAAMVAGGMPEWESHDEEPSLRCYATEAGCPDPESAGDGSGTGGNGSATGSGATGAPVAGSGGADSPVAVLGAADADGPGPLPATGGGAPLGALLAAGPAVAGVVSRLRPGRRRPARGRRPPRRR